MSVRLDIGPGFMVALRCSAIYLFLEYLALKLAGSEYIHGMYAGYNGLPESRFFVILVLQFSEARLCAVASQQQTGMGAGPRP